MASIKRSVVMTARDVNINRILLSQAVAGVV